jgi:hypothetical protein
MTTQFIRQLIDEGKNPLEKIKDEHNRLVYKYKFYQFSDAEWEKAVKTVRNAIQSKKNWETAQKAAEEEELANYGPKRTLPSAAAPGPGSHMAMTEEESDAWRKKMGYEIPGGGRHSRRHSRRHPRRHRGSRSGSSRMRSKGKRTYKKRNMRH